MLALDAFFVAYSLWDAISVSQDLNAIDHQKVLLNQATQIVNNNMALIDPKYQNTNDIGAITNYVFQGVNSTDNPDITTIGTNILIQAKRYDNDTKQAKPLIQE
jgi:hypothetical protein